jgi:hypothetical protein
MTWREFREIDLLALCEMHPAHLGDEGVGRESAIAIWKSLLSHCSFHGVAVECDPPIVGQRIVGIGAAVFVSAEFATAEVSDPRPGLNGRIIASIAAGKPVLLSKSQLRIANATSGIDVVVLCGTWRDGILSTREVSEVQMLLAASFVDHQAGYRVSRFLNETIGTFEIEFTRSTGVWRMVQQFLDGERALFAMDRVDGFAVPGSLGNLLFHYREPVLGLRETDQELLKAALAGATDSELAVKLHMSLPAIKKRWSSLFDHIADARIVMIPEGADYGTDRGGALVRGKQKRHYVIAYVRSHPEELRPYESRSPAGLNRARTARRQGFGTAV